jgi:RHS repeat-associated protein
LPYGDERTVTAQGLLKFATYWREHAGVDYADQRYYSATYGRFLTSDPYRASGGPSDPGSWNRYAYVQGDPVNFYDPQGLAKCRTVSVSDGRAEVQCATPLEGFRTVSVAFSGDIASQKDWDAAAAAAERSYLEQIEREEAVNEIAPMIDLARKAFTNPACQRLFAGNGVISTDTALSHVHGRINISFANIVSLIGPPREAETQGEGIAFSTSPIGFTRARALIKFDARTWQLSDRRRRLETFIHELGHAIHFLSVGTPTGGFVHEDRDPAVNDQNGNLIREHCVRFVFGQ